MGASSTGLDSHSYMQSVAALDAADDGMRKALRLLAAQQQRQYDPPSASRLSSRSTLSDTTLSGYRCVAVQRASVRAIALCSRAVFGAAHVWSLICTYFDMETSTTHLLLVVSGRFCFAGAALEANAERRLRKEPLGGSPLTCTHRHAPSHECS